MPICVEGYKHWQAAELVEAVPAPDFRRQWIVPTVHQQLLAQFPEGRRFAALTRALERMNDKERFFAA
jgi:hypothetical protein